MTQLGVLLGRRSALVAMVCLVGCDQFGDKKSSKKKKDDDDDDDSDKKKKKKKGRDDDDGEKEKGKGGEEKPKAANLEKIAFFLGRAWGYACVFATLKNAESLEKNMKEAKIFADGLGVPLPAQPNDKNGIAQMRTSEIVAAIIKTHGKTTGNAYWCGLNLTDAFFGAGLGADISTQLADVEKSAKGANIPETVWRANLDAAKAASKKDAAVQTLSSGFEKHYRAL